MFWRFRSRDRDRETDAARFTPVKSALDKALGDAEREHAGLKTRLEDARAQAAFIMGNDLEDAEAQRESTTLRDLESFFLRAEHRLRQLERQIGRLRELRALIDGIEAQDHDPSL